jgi:hypothetical protein
MLSTKHQSYYLPFSLFKSVVNKLVERKSGKRERKIFSFWPKCNGLKTEQIVIAEVFDMKIIIRTMKISSACLAKTRISGVCGDN